MQNGAINVASWVIWLKEEFREVLSLRVINACRGENTEKLTSTWRLYPWSYAARYADPEAKARTRPRME